MNGNPKTLRSIHPVRQHLACVAFWAAIRGDKRLSEKIRSMLMRAQRRPVLKNITGADTDTYDEEVGL